MILAPVLPFAANALETVVAVRPIGVLDRVLVESFAEAFGRIKPSGKWSLVVLVRDLVAMRGESLDRFLTVLDEYRAAGHRVRIAATPTWRKIVRGRGPSFEESSLLDVRNARRQIIICHSSDKRAGAA